MGRIRTSLNPFYGYPAEVIAEWCCVSVETAKHFKAGRRKPSPRVLKLFRLHAERKILTNEWAGWEVRGDRLIQPNGKHFNANPLEFYELVLQVAREKAPEYYSRLLRQTARG